MAKLTKAVTAQYVFAVEFEFLFSDTMVNIAGTELAFGADDAVTTTFDIMTPPPGAVVVGGVIENVIAAATSTTSTLDLGDSDDVDRYTPTIHDRKSTTAHSVLTPAGAVAKVYSGSQAIRATILNDGADTAGKTRIVVMFSMTGRANENLKTT